MNEYKRHARGGKFDKLNFGDLGLRAFQDQQKIIIDSLKLQQARNTEIGNEYITSLKGTHTSEKENRRILKNLENKKFENRRKHVEIRGKREVSMLLSKAEEYERESKTWQNLAPKLSKSLGGLAENLVDAHQKGTASQLMAEADEKGYWESDAFKLGVQLDAANQDEGRKLTNEALEQMDTESAKWLLKVRKSSNSFLTEMLVERIRSEFPALENTFADNFRDRNDKKTWEPKEIGQAYGYEANQIIQHFNLPNTKATRDLKNYFIKQGNLKEKQEQVKWDITETRNDIKTAVQHFKGKPDADSLVLLQQTIEAGTFNEGGTVVRYTNPKDIVNKSFSLVAEFFPTKQDYLEFIKNSPQLRADKEWTSDMAIDDAPKYVKTIQDRYKGDKGKKQLAVDEEYWGELWDASNEKNAKKDKDQLKKDASAAYNEIGILEEKGELPDFNTVKGFEDGIKKIKSYAKFNGVKLEHDNPATRYAKLMGTLRPGSFLENKNEENLVWALKEQSFAEASHYYGQVRDTTIKKHYRNKIQELADFEAAINNRKEGNSITALAHSVLKQNAGAFATTQELDGSANELVNPVADRIAALYYDTDNKGRNPDDKLRNAVTQVRKELQEAQGKTTGMFASLGQDDDGYAEYGGKDGRRVYIYGTHKGLSGKAIPKNELGKVNPKNLKSYFGKRNIISNDAALNLANEIDSNNSITALLKSPEYNNFEIILKQAPPEANLTMTTLINEYLKHRGYPQQIDPGFHELVAERAIKQKIPIGNMTVNNGAKTVLYQNLVDNEDWDALNSLLRENIRNRENLPLYPFHEYEVSP